MWTMFTSRTWKDHSKRDVEIVKTETEKQCSVCCKLKPIESFQGKLGELANQNSKKPERKAVKQANYNKVAG